MVCLNPLGSFVRTPLCELLTPLNFQLEKTDIAIETLFPYWFDQNTKSNFSLKRNNSRNYYNYHTDRVITPLEWYNSAKRNCHGDGDDCWFIFRRIITINKALKEGQTVYVLSSLRQEKEFATADFFRFAR
jgi:hypothetical protein